MPTRAQKSRVRPDAPLPSDHPVFAQRRLSSGSHFRNAVDAFRAEHQAWQNDRYRQDVDGRLHAAFHALFEAFEAPADRPGNWYPIFKAVARLKEKWDHYFSRLTHLPKPKPDDLWPAIEDVYAQLAAVTPKESAPIESPRMLWEQRVPLEQIARMHGIVDSDGKGIPHLVKRLIDEPDTDPATLDASAPKTAIDYWREGLSEAQAHAFTGMPEDELIRRWAEFEEKYGPQIYMDAEELGRYTAEKHYREKVVRQGNLYA